MRNDSSFAPQSSLLIAAEGVLALGIFLLTPVISNGQAALLTCPSGGTYGTDITGDLTVGTGFGDDLDDGTVHVTNVTAVFPDGIYFAGTGLGDTFTEMYINANGNITFNQPNYTYTPQFIPFTAATPFPIIAPWYADADFGGGGGSLWYCEDTVEERIIVTWESAGYITTSRRW